MPKQLPLIIGGLIVIGLIGVGAFVMLSKSKPSSPASKATQEQSNSQEMGVKSSIKSLLGVGKNVTCIISYPETGGSGTIYVANQKMRGDFTMMVDNKEVKSSMINDGTYTYMWSGPQGTKMKVEAMTASPEPGTKSQTADLNKEVDMKCSSWGVDNSKLNVPSDVQFVDLSTMMQTQQKPAGSSMPSTQKSYCDQITDPAAKAACMSGGGGQ